LGLCNGFFQFFLLLLIESGLRSTNLLVRERDEVLKDLKEKVSHDRPKTALDA
jgi:hypothetical protein